MSIIAKNKRAQFDYEVIDTFEAGIVLEGPEVKSIKSGQITLKGSYVNFNRGELYLINAHISPYRYARDDDLDPTRSRKLLLKKREIESIRSYKQSGYTLIPVNVKIVRGFVKVTVGIGRAKRKFDKRETIKKRETERQAKADIRERNRRTS